jgi:hypothetical protein
MSTEPTPVKLTDLTDEVLAEAGTRVLRSWANEFLADYNQETIVATVTLTDIAVSTDGVMSRIDEMFGSLVGAYAKRGLEPRRTVQYGELKMVVWQDDSSLRSSLRYARDRAIRQAEEEAKQA